MKKLYLIRKKLYTIMGPFDMAQLKDGYERMDFSAQDEICAHCGHWVVIEKKSDLSASYPELASIFQSKKRVSTYSEFERKNKKDIRNPYSNVKKHKKPSYNLAIIFLIFAVSSLMFGFILLSEPKYMALLESYLPMSPQVKVVENYFNNGDLQGFNDYMKKHKQKILEEINGSELKTHNPWAPYLRFFVFQSEGEIMGLTLKDLRGEGAVSAPLNCSYKEWLQNWKSSVMDWEKFLSGKKMPRDDWARLLAWDPHWVSRRKTDGWIEPINYYGACIFMAYKAFDALTNDLAFVEEGSNQIKNFHGVMNNINLRLAWLSSVVNKTQQPSSQDLKVGQESMIGTLMCLESVNQIKRLDSCLNQFPLDLANEVIQQSFNLNKMRLLVGNRKFVNKDDSKVLESVNSNLKVIDPFTRADLKGEKKLMDLILQKSGDVENAMSAMPNEFHEFHLK